MWDFVFFRRSKIPLIAKCLVSNFKRIDTIARSKSKTIFFTLPLDDNFGVKCSGKIKLTENWKWWKKDGNQKFTCMNGEKGMLGWALNWIRLDGITICIWNWSLHLFHISCLSIDHADIEWTINTEIEFVSLCERGDFSGSRSKNVNNGTVAALKLNKLIDFRSISKISIVFITSMYFLIATDTK